MANLEHLQILKLGVENWNKWRKKPDVSAIPHLILGGFPKHLREVDLSGSDLQWAQLYGANLYWANLRGANLQSADLREANLSSANLSGANLRGAHLHSAKLGATDLSGADLSGATLYRADLMGAKLGGADLNGADLRQADLTWTYFTKSNLHAADLTLASLQFADLSGADLSGAKLYGVILGNSNLTDANLVGADLQRASFVETNLEGADLSNSNIYGISAWNIKTNQDTKQLGLVITEKDEPIITVDNIEVAQLIYLLLKHENLRQVLNSVTERGVLILGRFGGGGIEVLRAVAEKLREMKYLPIIFDFDRPRDRNYTETIKTLTGLSRFVIVDLSGPSVPQELYATVPHFKIPFVPILEKGNKQYALFPDILEYDWVIKPIVEFDTTESLIKKLPSKIVTPAEKRHEKRQKLLSELFGK